MDTKQFLAGAAKVDITPPLGTYINGDFVTHYAQYIHDPLHVRALVFQQNEILAAMVIVDICVMPKEFLDEIKLEIHKKTRIAPDNILISSTHTHAAGSVASVYLGAADLQYMRKLPVLIVKSVVMAKQNIRPAKTGWGSVDVPEHVLCRRYKMKEGYLAVNPVSGAIDGVKTNPFGGESLIDCVNGKTDPQVAFLAVKGTDNKWISIIANYSLHYVGDWDNGTISADYFGVFADQIQKKLGAGDDFVGMMSNGTSGNINIWDFLNPERYPKENFRKSQLIGADIAEKVYQEVQHIPWDNAPSIVIKYKDLPLKLRKPNAQELQKSEQIVAESNFEQMQITDETLSLLYAREQILLHDLPDILRFPVQAIKIGRGVIGGLSAEIFAETGLWLKKNSPVKNYFTIGLANGNAGYVPPEHEFKYGGYETWQSRTSKLEEDAEAVIKNELLKLVQEVAGPGTAG
jgi:neutral ceramidase